MALREFLMPDAGEGLTEAEILEWRVSVGDVVSVNQVLVEVETAKAVVELPSPYAGTVAALLAGPGDVVPVGQPIIRIDETEVPGGASREPTAGEGTAASMGSAAGPGGGTATTGPEQGGPAAGEAAEGARRGGAGAPTTDATDALPGQRQPVLVGYGAGPQPPPRRRPRSTPHGVDHDEPGPPGEPVRPTRYGGLELARAVEQRLGGDTIKAKPPVRRLAHDLGVDLAQVVPTGPGRTITHEDVARAATGAPAGADLVPLSHVARMMARAMEVSASTAVHVTEWVDVDVTAMSAFMLAARAREELSALPITPLTFAALGLVRAAVKHPRINSTLDESGDKVRIHRGVHLGIAVDTQRGLLVPHVRDAQDLDLRGMAENLDRVVRTARAGRSRPEDLRGSTITITNVGVFGVDGGTPILNPGEVAILAVGRVVPRPWVVKGRVEVRDVVTLSLTFDHRVVDGALGSRVLRLAADFMADPATALALG